MCNHLLFMTTTVALLACAASSTTKTFHLRPTKDRSLIQEVGTRQFDLLLEYDHNNLEKVDHECVRERVKDYLPENIFAFMLSQGLKTEKDRTEFMEGWEVQEVVVEEVEVLEATDIDHPCEGELCTVTEISLSEEPCEGEQCSRRFLQNRLRTVRKKRRRLSARSVSICRVCYPDEVDDRRLWSWGSKYDRNNSSDSAESKQKKIGEKDSSGGMKKFYRKGGSSGSGESRKKRQNKSGGSGGLDFGFSSKQTTLEKKGESSDMELVQGEPENPVTAEKIVQVEPENPVIAESSVQVEQENPVTGEKSVQVEPQVPETTEKSAQEDQQQKSTYTSFYHERSSEPIDATRQNIPSPGEFFRIVITIIVEAVSAIIKYFQDEMAGTFHQQIEVECEGGFVTHVDFIYIPN